MGVPAVHAQLKRLRLSANWVLMMAFASPVPVPGGMEGAFVEGSDVLSWAANNSAKLVLPPGPQCWTLVSTQAYGKANKVPQVRLRRRQGGRTTCKWPVSDCARPAPASRLHRPSATLPLMPMTVCCSRCLQENVPPEVAERVTREMLAAFERSLGLGQGTLPPVLFSKTQVEKTFFSHPSAHCFLSFFDLISALPLSLPPAAVGRCAAAQLAAGPLHLGPGWTRGRVRVSGFAWDG